MAPQQIILGLATFLHDLFTVIWVGGLVVLALTLLPSARKVLGGGQQTRALMNEILRRHRVWVYISMVGLFITGVIQARGEPAFHGLMRFDTPYATLTAIKHLLTFAMIAIALFRSLKFGKQPESATPQQYQFSLRLIFINAVLGLLVLLLSGLMAAAG